jgi:hypothetical protein
MISIKKIKKKRITMQVLDMQCQDIIFWKQTISTYFLKKVKGTLIFRIVKHVFSYVLTMALEHVRCLAFEESSIKCAVMCCKGSKL